MYIADYVSFSKSRESFEDINVYWLKCFLQSLMTALNMNGYCQIQAQTNFSLNLWKLPFIFRIKMGWGSIAEDSFQKMIDLMILMETWIFLILRWHPLKCKPGKNKTEYRGELEVKVSKTTNQDFVILITCDVNPPFCEGENWFPWSR